MEWLAAVITGRTGFDGIPPGSDLEKRMRRRSLMGVHGPPSPLWYSKSAMDL